MPEPALQPLRIPGNWVVSYNSFHEVDASPSVRQYLCEDLFQATCPRTNVLVDLGWYPDGDVAGHFVLQVYLGDFTGQLLSRAEAPTRAHAVDILEAALWKYHSMQPST
jgi:hypothetical protein